MSIEHHVTSLELSRKLKELGVPQESTFWWSEPSSASPSLAFGGSRRGVFACSAFLASELGTFILALRRHVTTYPERDSWCTYDRSTGHTEWAETEADARANLLINLIEQGIVDPKELHAA